MMHASSPEWPAPPSLVRTSDGGLNATWTAPYEPYGRASVIDWVLCTFVACTAPTETQPRQRFVLISMEHALLRDYSGAVWVVVRASPTGARLRTTSIETITKQNIASRTIFARPIPAPAIEAAAYTIPKAIPTICTRGGYARLREGGRELSQTTTSELVCLQHSNLVPLR